MSVKDPLYRSSSAPNYGSCISGCPHGAISSSAPVPRRSSDQPVLSLHQAIRLDMQMISDILDVPIGNLANNLRRKSLTNSPHGDMGTAAFLISPSTRDTALSFEPESPHFIIDNPLCSTPKNNWITENSYLDPRQRLASVRLEVEKVAEEDRVFATVRYTYPLRSWFFLLTGVVAWASTGPVYRLLPDFLKSRPFRVAMWRYILGFIPFCISMVMALRKQGLNVIERQQLCKFSSWPGFSMLALTSLGGFAFYGLAVTDCRQFALAAGMAALNPFLLLIWDLLCRRSIGKWNWIGLCLALIGTSGMLLDDHMYSIRGTLEGLLGSIFFTCYVAAAEYLSVQLPFTVLMSVTFGIGAILAGTLSWIVEGTSFHGPESIWGFAADWDSLVSTLALTAVYTWSLTGLTASAKDLPALILAVAIALEPIVGVIIMDVGEHEAPTEVTASSLVFLVVGSIIVGCAAALQRKPEVRLDVTDAALPSPSRSKHF